MPRVGHSFSLQQKLAYDVPFPLVAQIGQPKQAHCQQYHRPGYDESERDCEQHARTPEDFRK